MKPGGGKAKGAQFERDLAARLSLWITHGKRDDCLWRSAMSGGRATIKHRKTGKQQAACGDLCAVSPEGFDFCEEYFVEIKHYRDLDILSFLLDNRGKLHAFWQQAMAQADQHKRTPLLIAKQNNRPTLVITKPGLWEISYGNLLIRALTDVGFRRYGKRVPTADVFYLHDILRKRHMS